jgi:glycosyltransferase involved in cell wall biosynthesis
MRPRKNGAWGLFRNYLSFTLSGLWHMPRLLQGRQYDVVLVYAISPITAAIPAIRIKRKLGAHLAVWVQDLWPQSLSATGYVKNKIVLKLVGVMVRWIYSRSDTLLAQSRSFVGKLEEYATSEKIVYYPNSIEAPALGPQTAVDIDLSYMDNGFSIVFAGNIGKAQAIPTLIEAAALLADSDCKLIFVGDGSMLEWARQEVSRLELTNVHFVGRVENRFMPMIYNRSDALLVTLSDIEIFSYTIPGKLQACLAAGKPIIASINGEAAEIIQMAGAGIVGPAEDAAALAGAILKIRNMDDQQRQALGNSGRKYFETNYDVNKQARILIKILEQRIKEER